MIDENVLLNFAVDVEIAESHIKEFGNNEIKGGNLMGLFNNLNRAKELQAVHSDAVHALIDYIKENVGV